MNKNKTLILINGGPSLSHYISTLGLKLSEKYEVVEYFQKGTPENPTVNKEELTLSSHLLHLKDVIDNHRDSQVILIGHSWGASLALLYLSENPNVISKAILIGAAPLNEELSKLFGENIQQRLGDEAKLRLQEIKSEFDSAESDDARNVLMQKRLKIIGPTYHFDPKTEYRLSSLEWNYSTFVTSIDSLWDFIDAGKVPQALEKISDPVVAFHGDFDPIPMRETFEFLSKNIKCLKTFEVKKAGHFPWLEPDAKDTFLVDLLREIEK